MESKWGKEGVRAYVFALRRSVIGGSDDAYQEAFQITPEEWDQQFDRYLKERFKPFRDKERPADYGRDLAPDPRKGKFSNVLSIEPSPSGDLIAGMTGNGRDREYDIVLISAKDGAIIRNLTSGFDQSMGFEYLATPGGRWNSVPWMSWSPQGDRLAYFVRTEKDRSLIVQNVVSKKIEVRIPLTTIDAPESPDFSPDGKLIAVLRHARQRSGHLHGRSRVQGNHQSHQGQVRELRADLVAGRTIDRLSGARQRQRKAVPHGCERRQPRRS
jgi:hypothetical protein